ncbi:MAG: hypothetical protein R2854_02930 [Caldilineaceae bacterium]
MLGGGFIGMEVAATLQGRRCRAGLPGGLIVRGCGRFHAGHVRLFSVTTASEGVEIFSRVKPKELLGSDGRTWSTSSGDRACAADELVVAGVGVTLIMVLARDTPLHHRRRHREQPVSGD